jgi:hypothetical protein
MVITTDIFVANAARILESGSANSTLKWALLLGLIDAAPAFARHTKIPLVYVAETVLRTYSRQSAAYPPVGRQLRQTAGGRADLAIVNRTDEVGPRSTSVAAVRSLAWTLAQWPAPRLQYVQGQALPLIFRVPASWLDHLRTKGSNRPLPRRLFETNKEGLPLLRVLPGAIDALLRVGPLLRQSIELRWTTQVAEINKIIGDPELSLWRFLFPSDFRRLFSGKLREALLDLQDRKCAWCAKPVSVELSEVDHVVPWSVSRNDAAENLAIAHKRCNQLKSDLPLHPELARRWLQHLDSKGQELQQLAAELSLYSNKAMTVAWICSQYRLIRSGSEWATFAAMDGHPRVQRVSRHEVKKGLSLLQCR